MTKETKQNETEVTQDGAVEIRDEQLDAASGGVSDYLLELDSVKGESKILGGGSVKLGDGSVRGIKFNVLKRP